MSGSESSTFQNGAFAIEIVNHRRPPNFYSIVKVFPMASGKDVIFAYGKKIYVLGGGPLSIEIVAHEAVHCARQLDIGVKHWWDRYLTDPNFRYQEELVAHQAEYQALIGDASSRQKRRGALKKVAKKLSSPIYGRMVTVDQAKTDIAGAA